jgi:hypothetical protein
MNAGGTLLSLFGMITGCAYLARAFYILFDVPGYEKTLGDDDLFNNNDDAIW